MTLKDRGLMKFRTVALQPEFISNLRNLQKEQDYVKKPEIDEQQLEYFDQIIHEKMEFNDTVSITHFKDHRYEITIGKIHYYAPLEKTIRIVDNFNSWFRIKLENIIDIQ